MRLENKVVLLSGVGPGMGRAMALLFAQEGARVALLARKAAVMEFAANEINESSPGQAIGIQADRRRNRRSKAVAQTLDTFGRLDVYVTLAGGVSSTPTT